MNFPSFADTEAFMGLGKSCSRVLANWQDFNNLCYNGIRPIGSAIYFGIAHLFSSDPITINYITLALNLFSFFIISYSIITFFSTRNPNGDLCLNVFESFVIIAIGLILSISVIPVALSDISSAAPFSLATAILFNNRLNTRNAFWIGLLFGISCLLRQYYYAFTTLAIISYLIFDKNQLSKENIRPYVLLAVGCSPSLYQFYLTWIHSGSLWVYDSKSASLNGIANLQPYVEMLIYTNPHNAAYLTEIVGPHLNSFTFFCIKLMKGLYSFYPAVYLGESPLASEPQKIIINDFFILKSYISFFSLILITAFGLWKFPINLKRLLLSTLLITITFAAIGHVESRYFFFSRFVYISVFTIMAIRFFRKPSSEKNTS